MHLLIAGCGYLGREVARQATTRGAHVTGLRRSDSELPPGVAGLQADLNDPGSLALDDAFDAVVYCAAPDERSDAGYARAYPRGLSHLLTALESASPGCRVIFTSSTGVYGQTSGEWVDEDSPTSDATFSAARLCEAEGILESSDCLGTSLRLGGLYGPTRTRLISQVRAGTASYSRDAVEWTNRIHRDDAARAALHVLGLASPPSALCVVDPNPAPRRDVLEFLAQELRAPAPTARLDSSTRGSNKRVSSRRLVATGFDFQFPSYREGYTDLLARPSTP